MKDLPETFPDFKCEVVPPQVPEPVSKEIANSTAGPATIEQAIHYMNELSKMGYNRSQICGIILHFFPRAKTSKLPNAGKRPLEVERVEKNAEIDQCVEKMEYGKDYGLSDFVGMLQPGSRFLSIKNERARETAIGLHLMALAREGKLVRVKSRRASYSLPIPGDATPENPS